MENKKPIIIAVVLFIALLLIIGLILLLKNNFQSVPDASDLPGETSPFPRITSSYKKPLPSDQADKLNESNQSSDQSNKSPGSELTPTPVTFTGYSDDTGFTKEETNMYEQINALRRKGQVNEADFTLSYNYETAQFDVYFPQVKDENSKSLQTYLNNNYPDIPKNTFTSFIGTPPPTPTITTRPQGGLYDPVATNETNPNFPNTNNNPIAIRPTNSANQNSFTNSAGGSNSGSNSNQNESLKKSAINMMEAILDITNSNSTSPQSSPSTITTPSTSPLTPGAQPTSAPIDSTPNTTYTTEAQTCLKNKSVYQQAAAQTGVPWEILAGIHYVEGGCATNQSLVSGRVIGNNEPDVHGNCSSSNAGPGKPYPIAGGCAFRSLLDTAIYGANHLIGKIGRIPSSQQDYAKALGRYNGTGNANCGRTPFASCPAPYEGYDHIYPMSKLDSAHQTMYLVYCADYTQCNPPKVYTRPGVLTIAALLQNN